MSVAFADTFTMDVTPFPAGQGFNGGKLWWEYIATQDEGTKLQNLVTMALLDSDIQTRLLIDRDEALMDKFQLTSGTKHWLRETNADNLEQLAEAILHRTL